LRGSNAQGNLNRPWSGVVAEMFGFDFAGAPNGGTDPYPLANLFLRLDAVGPNELF